MFKSRNVSLKLPSYSLSVKKCWMNSYRKKIENGGNINADCTKSNYFCSRESSRLDHLQCKNDVWDHRRESKYRYSSQKKEKGLEETKKMILVGK